MRKSFSVLFSHIGFQCSSCVLQGQSGHLLASFRHNAWRLKAQQHQFFCLLGRGREVLEGQTAFRELIRSVPVC